MAVSMNGHYALVGNRIENVLILTLVNICAKETVYVHVTSCT